MTYESLNPELANYIEPMVSLGQMIRHPLVFSVPYFGEVENERLNKLLEFRKEELRKALEKEDYESFVFIHERPYRLSALMEIRDLVSKEELTKLILSVYIDSENINENYDDWFEIFDSIQDSDPWDTLKELPDTPFTIYRGGSRNGFSWTLSLDNAKWFASRWGNNLPVYEATVTKNDILGYYDGRGEKEIIVNPSVIAHLIEDVSETP